MTTARVEVTDGPDAGLVVELALGRRAVVGRADDADVRLRDAAASRRHCALEHRLAGVEVEDLGSAAGTYLGGVRIAGRALVGESLVRVGQSALRVTRLATREAAPLVPGLALGALLGQGASGAVFEAVDTATGAAVAAKVLAADADATTRARFESEARLAARLVHPGIARIFDLRRAADGRPVLVRELVRGPTLEAEIARRGPLPWREVAALGVALARALEHAHGQGVVHRDLKPGNVVLDAAGPRLIDFDLAKREARATQADVARLTGTGEGLGSLSYLAPEQLTGARDVDGRADVYGLGATLYHAACGRRPFDDTPPEDYLDALARAGPRALASLVPGLDPRFAAAVSRAMSPRREARLARAQDVAAALEVCLA